MYYFRNSLSSYFNPAAVLKSFHSDTEYKAYSLLRRQLLESLSIMAGDDKLGRVHINAKTPEQFTFKIKFYKRILKETIMTVPCHNRSLPVWQLKKIDFTQWICLLLFWNSLYLFSVPKGRHGTRLLPEAILKTVVLTLCVGMFTFNFHTFNLK